MTRFRLARLKEASQASLDCQLSSGRSRNFGWGETREKEADTRMGERLEMYRGRGMLLARLGPEVLSKYFI